MSKDSENVIENFVERMGVLAQDEGLARTAGRLLGLLIIHGGPLSFSDLANRLQVSRGSISTNTRVLENLGILERTTRPGERQDHFQIRPRPYLNLLQGHLQRVRNARAMISETRAHIPADWTGAISRLNELDEFYAFLAERTEAFVRSHEKETD